MEIKQREEGVVTIVEFIGQLDSETSLTAENHIFQLIDKGAENLIIDLTQTEFINSAGLKFFLAASKQMKLKKRIKFCNPNEIVLGVLELSGFMTILDVKRSVEAALQELNPEQ